MTLLAVPALAGSAGPGTPGVGDSYFPKAGNGGYNVSHYDIRLRYQPKNDRLRGTTTIAATPTKDLTTFNLDFALDIKSVLVNGIPAEFVRKGGTEVTVAPEAVLQEGSPATFVVRYSDKPSTVEVDGANPWVRTSDGALAVGQPQIAEWWFPSSDHPTDKATFDVSVAVPEGTEVLSNGKFLGRYSRTGWTRWNWRMTSPSATYLAFLAIGQYEIHNSTGAFGQPSITAYSEGLGELEGAAKASIERTPEVLRFLSGLFGEYPFEVQGGVVSSEGLAFALETQTRPVYSHLFFRLGSNTSVVVHELAHQWFGDSVAVEDWSDIWINEGFATYSEWLWSEAQGTGSAQELFDHYYSSIPADDPFWDVTIGDPGREDLFSGAVYVRGAMTLHALRNRIGERVLLETVRTWVEEYRGGNASVRDFIALTERISGEQLDEFFREWLFTPAKPELGKSTGVPRTALSTPSSPEIVPELNRTHRLLTHSHNHG